MSSQNKRDNYHIISLIGKGAYGQVYKARIKGTGQFVAIKTIKKKNKQEKDIKAMREQIQILKKLKHPNIVVLMDSFQTNTQFIIVTELGQGELFNIIQDDQFLEESEIRKVAQQLVAALNYIHSNRITHRDLKPQNILMTSEGNIKLCDFGFARHMSHKTQVLTSLKGTPLYMAPQVVQEQPYTHTADLWSLGVILYELSTGSPPFSAVNLFNLVQHISKDPVRYPESIQGDFKNLLKGLLNKDPNSRLGWPALLHHPFIKETEQQKVQRKQKIDKFSNWIQDNHYAEEQNSFSVANAKSFSQPNFDEKSRQISPHKVTSSSINKIPVCNDPIWNNYFKLSNQQKGANKLRSDPQFLQQLLKVLSGNTGQIIRNKQQKNILQCVLKVLTQVLMKSKTPQNKQDDISKKLTIPNSLLNLLKSMLKVQNGKNYIQTIGDIIKLIGLLARTTFSKSIGIQMVYVRSFIPLLPSLLTCTLTGTETQHQNLVKNLLRTIGIFANNASSQCLRSFSFYKDIIQTKFIPDFLIIFKHFQQHTTVTTLLAHVVSVFMHPVYGDIEQFPWKRTNNDGIVQYNQLCTMLDCVKQSIINGLLQMDWISHFQSILGLQNTQNNTLAKISISRIVLQSLRMSKQIAQNLLSKANPILKYIFSTLTNTDPVVYGTSCLIISHALKNNRQLKKDDDNFQKQYITEETINLLVHKLEPQGNKNSHSLHIFGSLSVIQQLIAKNSNIPPKIQQTLLNQKTLKTVCSYLSQSQKSKLQQMRNLQGSNYGIHSIGYYDPVFLCYHRLIPKLYRENHQKATNLLKPIFNCKIQVKLSDLIVKLSSKTDISPRGIIAYLLLLIDFMNNRVYPEFLQPTFMKNIINLLGEQQVASLHEWPSNFGGGDTCLQILIGTLLNLFILYLKHAQKQQQILKIMHQNELIKLLIQFSKHLDAQTIITVITFINHLLSFSNDKTNFTKQFITFGGLSLFTRFDLLQLNKHPESAVAEACDLLSQLAKSSKQAQQSISSINCLQDLKKIVNCKNIQTKARVLYLLGNMFRHSNYFYKNIGHLQIIKDVISCLYSDDKSVRKYACIALGNAAFHDNCLYSQLKPAITALVPLLKDSDEKIRSNSAAALGNFARNSNQLDGDFVSSGAIYQIVNVILNDKSLAAKKVSIMAVTNLLDLKESSALLKTLNIGATLGKFVPPVFTADPSLSKSAQKALQKLK